MRTCCVSRASLPADELVRFAVSPDNVLVPDIEGKAPGRGVWVTLSAPMIERAIKTRAFARSLKAPVLVPDDLALQVRERLEGRLLGALGLARKAGSLATGATKVKKAIVAGQVAALFTARDASADGRRKMAGALKAHDEGMQPDAPKTRHFEILGSDQLGLALGLENVIHAALIAGPASVSAIKRADRLARFLADAHNENDETAKVPAARDAGS